MSQPTETGPPSVSVIIPCYNAANWVAECITSCLNQTFTDLEIIIVDDGSTDGTRSILEEFADQVHVIRQPNSGGCAARNAGFERSRGEFVQFLDADDYLLPEKIQRQRDCLIETGADVVYGDWRHQHHEPDLRVWLEDIEVSGAKDDLVLALLEGWWVAQAAVLYRSSIVRSVKGWDESLPAAQDRDFLTRVAMQATKIAYQPGCQSIYRRYGNVTVSTSNSQRYFDSHLAVVEKLESILRSNQRLSERYKAAIAGEYFHIARNLHKKQPDRARQLVQRCKTLHPPFAPNQSLIYDVIFNIAGFGIAERVAQYKKQLSSVRDLRLS